MKNKIVNELKRVIRRVKKRIPKYVRLSEFEKSCDRIIELEKQLEMETNELLKYKTCVPTGHFYSPYPDIEHIRSNENRIFKSMPLELPGIELNTDKQLALFEELAKYYAEIPFESEKKEGLRYWFKNEAYQYSDGICLYGMIRHLKPKKIVEVGSGYSSCATLDTNEIFFNNSIKCVFIEPYPDLLKSLLKDGDKDRIEIVSKNLQDVELSVFESLEPGDILFIDSTHVSKIDSDVNYIFFEILPRIASGVYIHFHDVIYPFEYWPDLIYKGISWNEAYFVRAFMQYNNSFEIVFYNTYLEKRYPEIFIEKMPLCMKNLGGSIWLKKI